MRRKVVITTLSLMVVSFIIWSSNSILWMGENSENQESENEMLSELENFKGEINKLKELLKVRDEQIDVNKILLNNISSEKEGLELDIRQLVTAKEYYKEFIDEYLSTLSDDMLIEIAKKEWKYKLYIIVGGKVSEIPSSGIIEIKSKEFSVGLSERLPEYPILSDKSEIFDQGPLLNYRNHIKLKDIENIKYEEQGRDGTVVTSKEYIISDVFENKSVIFEISDELRKRLNYSTNIIEVKIIS